MSIIERFRRIVSKCPEKIAVRTQTDHISYTSLNQEVNRCIAVLQNNGFGYGDLLGVQLDNYINSIKLILAASALGICLVPINTTMPVATATRFFSNIKVKKLLVTQNFANHITNNFDKVITWEDVFTHNKKEITVHSEQCLPRTSNDTLLVLTPTSGVSGEPKFIILTHGDKLKRIDAHISLFGVTEKDCILTTTPLYHSLAFRLALMSLLTGATLVMMKRFDAKEWFDVVHKNNVTFTIAVSTQLGQIAQLLSSPFLPELDSLRILVSSSAQLENYVRKELIRKLPCDLYEIYGTSECSTMTCINLTKDTSKCKSVGKAVEGSSVVLHFDDNTENNEIGEILCSSKLLASGYYGQEELWNKSFVDGYFNTGDLGNIDHDGYLYFHGRKDELIISDGVNVYPESIEQCLLNVPGVVECAAFSCPDDRLGNIIAAAVETQKDNCLTESFLMEYCERNLADYQRPSLIMILDYLPKNPVGKIMKSKVIDLVLTKLAGRSL